MYKFFRRIMIALAGLPLLSGLSSCINRPTCKYGGPPDFEKFNKIDTTNPTDSVDYEGFDFGENQDNETQK